MKTPLMRFCYGADQRCVIMLVSAIVYVLILDDDDNVSEIAHQKMGGADIPDPLFDSHRKSCGDSTHLGRKDVQPMSRPLMWIYFLHGIIYLAMGSLCNGCPCMGGMIISQRLAAIIMMF
jgi:hypothetical protein